MSNIYYQNNDNIFSHINFTIIRFVQFIHFTPTRISSTCIIIITTIIKYVRKMIDYYCFIDESPSRSVAVQMPNFSRFFWVPRSSWFSSVGSPLPISRNISPSIPDHHYTCLFAQQARPPFSIHWHWFFYSWCSRSYCEKVKNKHELEQINTI